jgi:hypothetical protein
MISTSVVGSENGGSRDASGYGASEMPSVKIVNEKGKKVAEISYNGRVWPKDGYTPAALPLYDNDDPP